MSDLRTMLSEVIKARDELGNQAKKVPQLEAEVADLKCTNSLQRCLHQSEIEGLCDTHKLKKEGLYQQLEAKDCFCEVEKTCVLSELQVDYKAKLPALYDEQ